MIDICIQPASQLFKLVLEDVYQRQSHAWAEFRPKSRPRVLDELHLAHRQQQTVEVIATGTFLDQHDSTRYS